MSTEVASIYAKTLIESLLSVHALTNMHRSSGDEGYRRAAACWLPIIERQLNALRNELTSPEGSVPLTGDTA